MTSGIDVRSGVPLALVVGGGGMGMATARRLGQTHPVVVADVAPERAAECEAALRQDGIDAVGIPCDVTDASAVADLATLVAARGSLRTLAHVVGLGPSAGGWREIFQVNLTGAALVERMCLDLAVTGTAAVFIASSAGYLTVPPAADLCAALDDPLAPDFLERLDQLLDDHTALQAYRLSKYALIRMCRSRASAWGAKGARIVSMSPGLIATPMGARETHGPGRDVRLNLMGQVPIGREGTMVETADAIEFLTSDRASYITGIDLLVDGGVVAATRPPAN